MNSRERVVRAVEFRNTLIEGGVPEGEAMEMTREYMRTVTNWKSMVGDIKVGEHRYKDE